MLGKRSLLLHTCCAPCLTHPYRVLKDEFEVRIFFYNPNIQPRTEYLKRLSEVRKLADAWRIPVVESDCDTDLWQEAVAGLESEPEGGKRCEICHRLRMEKTARKAGELGYDLFSTTLTLSPLKNAERIFSIGKEIETKTGVSFHAVDFKKKDGFKISSRLSRELGLYRQDYCGCLFSMRRRTNDRTV